MVKQGGEAYGVSRTEPCVDAVMLAHALIVTLI